MNNAYNWYQDLIKPDFAPPAFLFGPVWSFLYTLILISFGFVLWQCIQKKLPWKVFVPFGLNIVFNLIFSPIQFGLQNLVLASVDIVLVLATIIWMMCVIWKHYKWVAYMQIPYFAWVLFATILQINITLLNW